jgi:aryl-alcohol dehydrogenase-like predicted oxidoreductase
MTRARRAGKGRTAAAWMDGAVAGMEATSGAADDCMQCVRPVAAAQPQRAECDDGADHESRSSAPRTMVSRGQPSFAAVLSRRASNASSSRRLRALARPARVSEFDEVAAYAYRDTAGPAAIVHGRVAARDTPQTGERIMKRREWLGFTLGAGAALALPGCRSRLDDAAAQVLDSGNLLTRPIPSSGERVPMVGLGSSATFAQVARSEDVTALRDVMRTMAELGGTVFDTAPSYGASEEVSGRIAQELGITDDIFWATKVNVARGGGAADPAEARAQIETSFERLRTPRIDLIQVHNLGDVPVQLGILKELKAQDRVRYIGVTTTSQQQYGRLEEVMRNEPIDFIGIDYAIDNRNVEETILPLAQQRNIAVMVYLPFGRTRLWNRVSGRDVPEWASEFDANSWAQFFLKFVAAHPAVTVITPATSQPRNMADNMGAAMGRLPDEETRRRMIEVVDALPPA